MNNYSNRLIKRCLNAGILGISITCIGVVVTDRSFDFGVPLYGFLLGFLTGVIEMYFLRRAKISSSGVLISLRTLFYITNITFCLVFTRFMYFLFLSGYDPLLISQSSIVITLVQSTTICLVILLYLQLEAIVGVGIFHNFLVGRYHKPKKEWRYFMFLDLNNSTQMIETLGDDVYFAMLNTYFRDLSKPIFESGASIYKYMGDEIMLTWKDKSDFRPETALCVYTTFKDILETKKEFYRKTFGVYPTFKAGLHYGQVITAKVGDLKKEIAYNGDVLNITTRIMERCKEFKQGLIMSEVVYTKLVKKPKDVLEINDLSIVGKRDSINVFGLR